MKIYWKMFFRYKELFSIYRNNDERYEIESIHLVEIMTCVSLTLSCVTLSITNSKKVVDTDKKSFLSVDNHSLFYVNFTCIVCVKCHAALIPENHRHAILLNNFKKRCYFIQSCQNYIVLQLAQAMLPVQDLLMPI